MPVQTLPRRLRLMLAMSLAVASAALPAAALAEYPDRPIRLIVPFSPGGLTDTGARMVAEKMGQVLGQPLVVDNRPGAGGNIGAQAASVAAPDGYTLLLGFDGTLAINPHVYSKISFDTARDFTAVGKLGDVVGIIVANPLLPVKNYPELVAYSRSRPEGVSYGSSGVGGTSHLVAETLNRRSGANFVHVPYKGGGQAMADVVSGTLPINFTAVAGAYNFIKQGQVRAIAVTSAQRMPSLPDVPTIAESGLPGFSQNSWIGIMAPAKTPAPVLEKLRDALKQVLANPELKERLATLGVTPTAQTPAEFGAQIRADLLRYGEVVKALGVKLD